MDIDKEIEEGMLADLNPRLDNWLNRKAHAKNHAAAHADFLKQWRADRDKKRYGGDRLALAADVGRAYRHVDGRTLVAYHQDKVAKGELPSHMSIGKQSAEMKKKVLQIAKTTHKSVSGRAHSYAPAFEAASPSPPKVNIGSSIVTVLEFTVVVLPLTVKVPVTITLSLNVLLPAIDCTPVLVTIPAPSKEVPPAPPLPTGKVPVTPGSISALPSKLTALVLAKLVLILLAVVSVAADPVVS